MMIKEYKHMIKLQRFPMEQMHLKCVKVKCYQKINGALIKLYYLQQKYQSDNTNMSQDFGGNTYNKINKWQYK